jgi:hypothetical protein
MDQHGHEAECWSFGPFPAGLNQTFILPTDHLIDNSLLQEVGIAWMSELDLAISPLIVQSPTIAGRSINASSATNQPPLNQLTGSNDAVSVQIETSIVPKTPRNNTKKIDREPNDPYHLIIALESENDSRMD